MGPVKHPALTATEVRKSMDDLDARFARDLNRWVERYCVTPFLDALRSAFANHPRVKRGAGGRRKRSRCNALKERRRVFARRVLARRIVGATQTPERRWFDLSGHRARELIVDEVVE
jgi:hypothetical protein